MAKQFYQNYTPLKQLVILVSFGLLFSCGKKDPGAEAYGAPKPEVDFFKAQSISGEVEKKYPGIIDLDGL